MTSTKGTTGLTYNVGFNTDHGTDFYYVPAHSSMFVTDSTGVVVRNLRQSKKVRGDCSYANLSNNRLRVLTPVVMYKFIKSRFKLLERRRLTDRFEKIAKLMESAKVLGQIAMADNIAAKFGRLIREQELLACGYTEYISKKIIEKFIDATTKKVIKLTPLKNYVRLLPKKVQKKIVEVQEKKLFDSLLVLHTDVNNTAVAKTAEEKRDPILFGAFNEAPDILYHVISWEDEWCDLTFDKLVEELKLDDTDVAIESDVSKSFMEALI